MAAQQALNVSLMDDKELRPWANCDEIDQEIDCLNKTLDATVNNCSPQMNAGFIGYSALDAKDPALSQFQDIIEVFTRTKYDTKVIVIK